MLNKNIKNIFSCSFMNIKSKYILKQIFDNIELKTLLKIVKYSKIIQGKLEIGIKDYEDYIGTIEIEIIPPLLESEKIYYTLINCQVGERRHCHIYLNDKNNPTKKYFLTQNDANVNKIIIVIDKEVKTFHGLFSYCNGIEKINFIKFNRTDITDMNSMFYWCGNLIEADFEKFKTNNVTNMGRMFFKCGKLKSLNLNSFDTTNVVDMSQMFKDCTNLRKIEIENFKTDKLKDTTSMFKNCPALREINISKLNLKTVKHMNWMFSDISDELKIRLKNQNKNIREEAFDKNKHI